MNQIETTAQKIRNAYEASYQPGAWALLTILREDAGALRADFDAAIKWLAQNDPTCTLSPESNQKCLRPQDRSAAVWSGNQWKHLASFF